MQVRSSPPMRMVGIGYGTAAACRGRSTSSLDPRARETSSSASSSVPTGLGVSTSFLLMAARRLLMAKANNPAPAPGDRLVWREAVRSVTPLRRGGAATRPPSGATKAVLTEKGQGRRPVQPSALDQFSGIDRANAERLKRGLHPIEA